MSINHFGLSNSYLHTLSGRSRFHRRRRRQLGAFLGDEFDDEEREFED